VTTHNKIFAFAAIVIAAGALVGCRAEEQGRPLILDKGTYRGKADTPLSKAKLDALKDRAALQGSGGLGGGTVGPTAFERPTQEKPAPTKKRLSDRVRLQVGPPSVRAPGQSDARRAQTNAASPPAAAPAPAAQPPSNPPKN
jgi:hypothetical protein